MPTPDYRIRHDLNIYRGTYAECMAQKTENMKIYLAWDTQEIFVGNANGKKVQYGVSKSVYNEIDARMQSFSDTLADRVDAFISEYGDEIISNHVANATANIQNQIAGSIRSTKEEIQRSLDSINKKIENTDRTIDVFYTKTNELSAKDNELSSLISSVDEKIENLNLLKREDFNNIAFSGDYRDLRNIPDNLVTEENLREKNFAQAAVLENYFRKDELNSSLASIGVVRFNDLSLLLNEKVDASVLSNYATLSDLSRKANSNELDNYVTKELLRNSNFASLSALNLKADKASLSNYILKSEIDSYNFLKPENISGKVNRSELNEYSKAAYVNQQISSVRDEINNPDIVRSSKLLKYYTSEEIDSKLNSLATKIELDKKAPLSLLKSEYTTKTALDDLRVLMINLLENKVDDEELENYATNGDLSNYALLNSLDEKVNRDELSEYVTNTAFVNIILDIQSQIAVAGSSGGSLTTSYDISLNSASDYSDGVIIVDNILVSENDIIVVSPKTFSNKEDSIANLEAFDDLEVYCFKQETGKLYFSVAHQPTDPVYITLSVTKVGGGNGNS